MIKVSVFYPNQEGSKFDMDYYCNSHMPMVRQKLGAACKGAAVEQGIAGATQGSRPAFIAMGHLYFEFGRGLSDGIRSPSRGDHGRHSQLHRHPADAPDQRREDAGVTKGTIAGDKPGSRLFGEPDLGDAADGRMSGA